MRPRGFTMLFLLVSLLAVSVAPLFAQTQATGAIVGTVTDTSGAVIPGATVTATHTETGQARTVTTGADGNYRFALLPPGTYSVKFSATGFKMTEVPGLTVAVTESPTLNQKLELGTQSEQVTINASAETIQTSSAALGTVLGSAQVTALPMTTRNYTNTLALSAGVDASVTNAETLGNAGMNFAVNGAGTGSNNLQIDGANMTTLQGNETNGNPFGSSGSNPVPSPDALQEFKVQTSAYDAGYGRNSGANVNAVTKSGTNEFHGTAFEFFRNTVLNANDFFLNRSGLKTGVLDQNQYGGVVGGPIKKNKLFFFGSYEGTYQRNGIATQGNTSIILPPIPTGSRTNTAQFRAALGAAFCPANHPGNAAAYNTLRGGVQVACDGSNINPVAINLMQYQFPDGSYMYPGSATGGFQSVNIVDPTFYKEQQYLGNIDYILSDKHTLAVKFFNSYAPTQENFWGGGFAPGFRGPVLYWDTYALAKLTSVLTSSLVNEARITMHREVGNYNGNLTGLTDHQFGIQPVSPYQDYNTPGFISQVLITGAYNVGGGSTGTDYSLGTSTAYQAADQISWSHGKHTIRAGFEAEQVRVTFHLNGLGQGNINISTFDDFLLGLPGCTPGVTTCTATNPGLTNGTLYSNIASTNAADGLGPAGNAHTIYVPDYDAFVNDDFKVSQRLTLTLGMRWEYDGLGADTHGVMSNIWPSLIYGQVPGNSSATGSLLGWVVPSTYFSSGQTYASVPGSPQTLLPGVTLASSNDTLQTPTQKDNFSPRFGFAWQPFGGDKFVVRGGYGFFYDRGGIAQYEYAFNNAPPYAPPSDKSGTLNYYSTLAVPFGPTTNSFPVHYVNFATGASSGLNQQIYGPSWKLPLTQQYNLNLQYNFLPSWVLELGYVGSHSTHLAGGFDYNQSYLATAANPVNGITTNTVANAPLRVPYLGFGLLLAADDATVFVNRYSSLQATVRKQLSHGLQMQVAYTWAKDMTDASISQNYDNWAQNYGQSGTFHPQRASISYLYNIPSGNLKGFVGALASGWSLSGITTIQSGTPLTITDARGGTIYGATTARGEILPGETYANLLSSGSIGSRLGGASGGCGYFYGTSVTGSVNGSSCASLSPLTTIPNAVAPDGSVTNGTGFGNMGIGVALGPGQFNFDTSLTKMTRVGGIHENSTLQFRVEFFNMMNHPQFSNPSTADNTATFGQITSTTVNPRLIQLALKYIF